MKKLCAALLLTFGGITACTQQSAPEVAYYQNEQLQIRAEVEPGAFDGLLKVYINNELSINQRSQAFGGSSQIFSGSWRGKPVTARATKVNNLMSSYYMIDVFIQGTLVETLSV